MSLQLHVLFVLYKAKQNRKGTCPLMIRLTYKGERRQLASGLFLSEHDWSKIQKGGRLRESKLQSVVAFMETFKAQVLKKAHVLEGEGTMNLDTLVELCLNKPKHDLTLMQLFDLHTKELTKRVSIDRSKATPAKYKHTEAKVTAFLSFQFQKRDIGIHKLEASFIQLFYDYLLLECGIQHNTIAKYCKNLKRILNFGIEKGYLKENPFAHFAIGYKDIDRSYLTASELAVLEKKVMPIKRLDVVRDLFLFQCYTGLAYIDMKVLKPEHLSEGVDKKQWLVLRRQKTNIKSTIPLLQPALQILRKYAACREGQNGYLLPVASNQKYNAYLKEIATICTINSSLSSHVGRRTFATTVALSNGVSLESIAKMLGHSSTKMTTLYAVVTDLKLSQEMEVLASKLKHG